MIKSVVLSEAAFLIELIKIALCLWGVFNYRFSKKLNLNLILCLTFSFMIISITKLYDSNFKMMDAIYVLLIFITVMGLFEGNGLKFMCVYFISYITISIVDMFLYLLIAEFMDYNYPMLIDENIDEIISNASTLLPIGLAVLFRKKFKKTIIITDNNPHWSLYILLLWVLFCSGIMVSYLQILQKEANQKVSFIMITSMIVVALGIAVISILFTRVTYSKEKYKVLSKMNQEYLEMQQKYYILLSEKNEDTRRFRHDVKNHFLCLLTLCQEGGIEEVKEYLEQLTENLEEIIPKFNTGSNVVDAVINEIVYKNPDINIMIRGCFPAPLLVAAMDLCTIFYNSVTNAAEAVSKLERHEDKKVNIEIRKLEDNIFIQVANPTDKKVLIENNKAQTSKTDKDLHGYGLGNISNCVKKYHGTMNITSTENAFVLEVLVKNKKVDQSRP